MTAIVMLDEPTPIFGGLVAAPVFADVMRYGLRQFRVPPPPRDELPAVPEAEITDAVATGEPVPDEGTPVPTKTTATVPPANRPSKPTP